MDLGNAYRPERGWGMQSADSSLIQLQARVADLEKKLGEAKTSPAEYIDGFTDCSDLCGVCMVNI